MNIDPLALTLPTAVADGSLRSHLASLLRAGGGANPALDALIRDYTVFHVVLVVVGGLLLLAVVVLGVVFWTRFARAGRDESATAFERRTYAGFGVLTVIVGLFLALVVAANVSTVVSPRSGFSGSLGLLGSPQAGSRTAQLQESVATSVKSGRVEVPSLVDRRIDDRLAWQRPKAIVCTALLAAFVVISSLLWRTLIRRSRTPRPRQRLARTGLLTAGTWSVAVTPLRRLGRHAHTGG